MLSLVIEEGHDREVAWRKIKSSVLVQLKLMDRQPQSNARKTDQFYFEQNETGLEYRDKAVSSLQRDGKFRLGSEELNSLCTNRF